MRKLLLAMACLAVLAGCRKPHVPEEDPIAQDIRENIVGTWSLEDWDSEGRLETYIDFEQDGTFELYQRIYTTFFEHYSGSWQVDGTTLSGSYADGTEWADSYTVTFAGEDGFTLTSVGDGVSSSYVRADIPEDVLSGALEQR